MKRISMMAMFFSLVFFLFACSSSSTLTIQFESNSDLTIISITVDSLDEVVLPTDLTQEGYTFDGWYINEALSEEFVLDESVFDSSQITLYARWTPQEYTVHFETDGGSQISMLTVPFQGSLSIPNPTKENHQFVGWFIDPGLTVPFEYQSMPSENLILYAKWDLVDFIPDELKIGMMNNGYINESALIDFQTELEDELSILGYDFDVNIILFSSNQEMYDAMKNHEIHIGSMDASLYAQLTLDHLGMFKPLVSTLRKAHPAEHNGEGEFITDLSQIIENTRVYDYDFSMSNRALTNGYYTAILVRTEDLPYYEENGVEGLIGQLIGVQSKTSNTGYKYPAYYLSNHDITLVESTPNPSEREARAVTIPGYMNAILALANNEVDAVFGFLDAREFNFSEWEAANQKTISDEISIAFITYKVNDSLFVVNQQLNQVLIGDLQNILTSYDEISWSQYASLLQSYGFMVVDDYAYDISREVYQFILEITE